MRSLPDRVTPTWLLLFVLVPTALSFAFDRSFDGLLSAIVGPIMLLIIVYVVTRYTLVAMTVWALRWTFQQLGDLGQLVTRVLPLMLLVVTFLYLSPGVWQAMGSGTASTVGGALLVLAAVAVLFVITRARRELAKVDESTDRAGVVAASAGTPLEAEVEDLPDLDLVVPMTARQRANLLLSMVVAQLVQVSLSPHGVAKSVMTCACTPRPVKSQVCAPSTSSHTRTQRAHRMQRFVSSVNRSCEASTSRFGNR